MIDRLKLVDLILDNQNDDDDKLISKIEMMISKAKPYNHSAEDVKKACRVSALSEKDLTSLGREIDKVSIAVEEIEKIFSKRDLAFMVAISKKKFDAVKDALQMIAELGRSL